MAFPDKLLNEGDIHDIPRVEQVQLKVAEELHRLAGRHGRTDDGA